MPNYVFMKPFVAPPTRVPPARPACVPLPAKLLLSRISSAYSFVERIKLLFDSFASLLFVFLIYYEAKYGEINFLLV